MRSVSLPECALGSSGAHHCTRLRFRELALALLPASPPDFGEVASAPEREDFPADFCDARV